MTQKVNPSFSRRAGSFETAGAISYGGQDGDGFIIEATDPTEISVHDTDLLEGNYTAFDQTSGAASLDVEIGPGEGFVFGAWFAKDTSTTVTLDASTAGQTIYAGWNADAADTVIIGPGTAFTAKDQSVALWEFDTDADGVTAARDLRRVGPDTIKTKFKKAAIPFSEIDTGDNASIRVNIPDGATLHLWQVGVQDGAQAAPSGLSIEVRDLTNSVTIYSANQKTDTGFPLTTKDGPIDVSFRISNDTGATVQASGYVVYTSD